MSADTTARLTLRQTTLVLLMGAAGTGKTTLASMILQRLQLFYLDNNFLADAFHPDTRRGEDYERDRPALYSALYRVVEENLGAGNSVLLVGPHVRQSADPQWPAELDAMLGRTRAKLSVVCCHCPEHVQRERLQRRDEPRDHWKLANWDEYAAAEPVYYAVPFSHLSVLTAPESGTHTRSADSDRLGFSPDLDAIVEHIANGPDGRTDSRTGGGSV